MDKERMNDGLIRNFLVNARGFTPIAVSADFAALRCPPCQGENAEGAEELAIPVENAA
ncbi:MAG TPA: hypothetical protein VF799_01390 [Geobacteraceae bacterium]